jgi:hypothetical protein
MNSKDLIIVTDTTSSTVKLSDKYIDTILANAVDIPQFLQAYNHYHKDTPLTSAQLLNLFQNYLVLTNGPTRAFYGWSPDEFFSRIPSVRIAYYASNLK